jgi:carboxymethylenebutenolidase
MGNAMNIELTAADGHTFSAYVAGPENAKKALVVVQEIFGVNKHMRRVCDDFAKEGFRVVCPALFDRAQRNVELNYEQADVQNGLALRAKIDAGKTLLDILASAAALPKGAKRGIVGYCWGGTVAWHGATRSMAFNAANCWYGGGVHAAKDEKPNCPVQMHFGEVDQSIPMPQVEEIRAAHPEVEIFVYKGAGHGFGCEDRASYKPEDAKLADERTLAFFNKHLG